MIQSFKACAVPLCLLALTGVASAEEKQGARAVRYAPVPAWVVSPPAGSEAPTPPGAPLRIVFADQQIRLSEREQQEFQITRMKLLTPEALGAGALGVSWSPAEEKMIVHRVSILRDGQTVDVLARQKFTVIQRENNLEQSMLDGQLTATLQVAGLQVGDELEVAMTKVTDVTSHGERPQGFLQLPAVGMRGAFRARLIAPKGDAIRYRASADLPAPDVTETATETDRRYLLTDPASVTLPQGAPPRFAIARLVQFSGYEDWGTVSRTFSVPFVRAGVLEVNSLVKAEATRIAIAFPNAVARVEAALRLVQDQIRYVYVGLDGGNYIPAQADATWRRRFGDCKAKTVLLIALLKEMGIAAEPVLVASKGGDGTDERLPTPSVFDHVVVRAIVDGKPVWLDGTRLGDRALAMLDPPASRWALPLRSEGTSLERIAALPPRFPARIQVIDLDASAGFDVPGKFRVQQTLRGDEIFGIRAQLAGVAPADADKMLIAYWRQQMSEVEPARVTWRFDDANRLLVLGMEGEGKVDWEGDATEGHVHYLYGAGFPPPDEMKRPKDQPQEVPWANDYPAFTCYATTVKLPPAGKGMRWSFSSNPMDRVLGGVSYWRISSFDGKVARMVKSRRVNTPEIGAAEAAAVPLVVPKFDNNKSYVWEVKQPDPASVGANTADRFGTFEDFAGAAPPCQSLKGASGGAAQR